MGAMQRAESYLRLPKKQNQALPRVFVIETIPGGGITISPKRRRSSSLSMSAVPPSMSSAQILPTPSGSKSKDSESSDDDRKGGGVRIRFFHSPEKLYKFPAFNDTYAMELLAMPDLPIEACIPLRSSISSDATSPSNRTDDTAPANVRRGRARGRRVVSTSEPVAKRTRSSPKAEAEASLNAEDEWEMMVAEDVETSVNGRDHGLASGGVKL